VLTIKRSRSRFGRQRDNADVDRAIFNALQNFVAEITVNADVYQRKAPLKLRENVRQQIQASRFVGSENHRSLHHVAAIGDELHGFVAQPQQLLRVLV
jgi:hypothetical protein